MFVSSPEKMGWDRIINPDLQLEKFSSTLRFGSKIPGAGASGEVKVATEEGLTRERPSLEEEGGEGACSP